MPIPQLHRVARLLAATTNHLRVEFAALGEEGAAFHPREGEWCAKEVVGHLVEADRRGFTGRVQEILASDRPALEPWDQEAVARSRTDCGRPADQVLEEFAEARREAFTLLDDLTEADLRRVGIHAEVGELRIGDIVHEWPYHDRDHLRQILENTRIIMWRDMGNARQFSIMRGAEPI
jgi:hypothetical protein